MCVKFVHFPFQVRLLRTEIVRKFCISATYVRKYDINVQLKPVFLQHIALRRSKLTKMCDNSNNVHSSGVRFI